MSAADHSLAAFGIALLAAVSALPLAGCETAPPQIEPAVRAEPRHPIRTPDPNPTFRSTGSSREAETRPLNLGPNARVSPTPDMAPRVQPTPRPDVPPADREIEALQRELRDQRGFGPEKPGPPAGTIDQRPGTIRQRPGTIEIPR